jgi:aryl-alcohol dehydrogenase-like predicted oxidoreductase
VEQRTLGKTGLKVSVLGLGGVFISSIGSKRVEAVRAIRRALELGVTYIDTARSYADSESVIGEALEGVSARPVISTKLGGWPMPFSSRSREGLLRSVDASMRELRVERLDMLMVHEPDRPGALA